MIVRDDLTRFSWLFFLKHESDAAEEFEKFLASVRSHVEVGIVLFGRRGRFWSEGMERACVRNRIKQEPRSVDSPQNKDTAEGVLSLIGTT